jgi:transposase-like protein
MNESNTAPATTALGAQPPSSRLTAEQKAEVVQKFLQSGLGLREYSRQHGIGYMSLYRWVRKERKVVAPPPASPRVVEFTEIKLPAQTNRSDWAVELSLPNGTVLRMIKDTPSALVEQLLRVC